MPIFGAAYELTFNREAGGAAIGPNDCRLYRSTGIPWSGTTTIISPLDRGYVPYPATGQAPNTRQIAGISRTLAGAALRLSGYARDQFGYVAGAATTNATTELIQRCGYNGQLVGRGRASPGDFVAATGNLRTALLNGGTATTLDVDCWAGPGYFDEPVLAEPARVWQTGNLNGGMWTSHLGLYDFVDDAVDQATRQDELFLNITNNGNEYALPDGFKVQDCSYAGISPEGMIWILPSDYGVGVPSNVALNSPNAFRNHPGVFVRRAGSSYLRGVARRWRDQFSITGQAVGQPIGISQITEPYFLNQSKWLIVCDGVADVVYIKHPANTDYRRPRDIWNRVIVPLIRSTGSNGNRVTVTDFYGNNIGTETRWQFLSYARFLGIEGSTAQDNTSPVGA